MLLFAIFLLTELLHFLKPNQAIFYHHFKNNLKVIWSNNLKVKVSIALEITLQVGDSFTLKVRKFN